MCVYQVTLTEEEMQKYLNFPWEKLRKMNFLSLCIPDKLYETGTFILCCVSGVVIVGILIAAVKT